MALGTCLAWPSRPAPPPRSEGAWSRPWHSHSGCPTWPAPARRTEALGVGWEFTNSFGGEKKKRSLNWGSEPGPNQMTQTKMDGSKKLKKCKKQDEAHEPECRHVCWQTETILICHISSKLTCETPWIHTLRWHSCRTPLLDTSYLTLS